MHWLRELPDALEIYVWWTLPVSDSTHTVCLPPCLSSPHKHVYSFISPITLSAFSSAFMRATPFACVCVCVCTSMCAQHSATAVEYDNDLDTPTPTDAGYFFSFSILLYECWSMSTDGEQQFIVWCSRVLTLSLSFCLPTRSSNK